jgi:hypothetical protein
MPTASAMAATISITGTARWISHVLAVRRGLVAQKEINHQAEKWHKQNHRPESTRHDSQWTTQPQSHDDNQCDQFEYCSNDQRLLIHMGSDS